MLSINPINAFNSVKHNTPSFGMAKFSDRGMAYAQSCSDIYEPLGTPNTFKNPEFFNKRFFFQKAPFTKFVEGKLTASKKDSNGAVTNSSDDAQEVADVIKECGATPNSKTNSLFIKQLIATKPYIDRLDVDTKTLIASACEEVLKTNWNNPDIDNDETRMLVELAKPVLDDRQYTVLYGVLQNAQKNN